MPMKIEIPPNPEFPSEKITRPAKRVHVPNLFGWVVAVFIIFVLAGLALPTFNTGCGKGIHTEALAQAKQVGLALKLYAGDHDGAYPKAGVEPLMKTDPPDSNTAFAALFPTYTQSEAIFGNRLSAYQTAPPDNVIDQPYTGTPKETLQPGENVYSYVLGLTEGDSSSTPLIADGTDGTGHYRTDPAKRGGVWKGATAVVIRLDNSGSVVSLAGPEEARYIPSNVDAVPRETPSATNLLDFSHSLRAVRLLDPAAGPRRR